MPRRITHPVAILVIYMIGTVSLLLIVALGRDYRISPPETYPPLAWYESFDRGPVIGSARRTAFAFSSESLESQLKLDESWYEGAVDYWDLITTTITADPPDLVAWGDTSLSTMVQDDHNLRRISIEQTDFSMADDGYEYFLQVSGDIDTHTKMPLPPTELASSLPASSSLQLHVARRKPPSNKLMELIRTDSHQKSHELVTKPVSVNMDGITLGSFLELELPSLHDEGSHFRFSLSVDVANLDANSEYATPLSPRVLSIGRDNRIRSQVKLAVEEARSTEYIVLDPQHRHVAMIFFFDRPAEGLVECRDYATGEVLGKIHDSGQIFAAVSDSWSPIFCRFAIRKHKEILDASILALSDYGRPSRKLVLEALVHEVRFLEIGGVRPDASEVLSISKWLADSLKARFSDHDVALSEFDVTKDIILNLIEYADNQAK